MKICFYTYAYPGNHDTAHYAFVKQLVDTIASLGNECYVVSPYNILHYRKFIPRKEGYQVGSGIVNVYRPYFLSFSDNKLLGKLTKYSRNRALLKAGNQLPHEIDVVYGHFWRYGYEGYHLAKERGLPLIVASGESDIKRMFKLPQDYKEYGLYVNGVICVSSKNRDESIKLGLTSIDKCGVFPNAINEKLFYKRDKSLCRQQLGFPNDAFIVAFVGWFNDRKGVLRVSEAIKLIRNVNSVFIGKGELDPQCEGILFKGELPHDKIPVYLSAADCFVLPTKAEGCCNAVIEAMACGLPIVSSNLPFNWDVLDDTNSIMVNPNNVHEIAKALTTLRDNQSIRRELSEGALHKSSMLTITERAKAILDFIKEKV